MSLSHEMCKCALYLTQKHLKYSTQFFENDELHVEMIRGEVDKTEANCLDGFTSDIP